MDATETPIEFDPSLPTFEVWLDGTRFASTQIPARAKKMIDGMTTGAAAKRYGYRTVELRIVNDRRLTDRDAVAFAV